MLLTAYALPEFPGFQFRSRYDAESYITDPETGKVYSGRSYDEVQEVPRRFEIPASRLPEFEAAIEKLSARAEKLGLGTVVATQVGVEQRGIPGTNRTRPYVHFHVDVPAAKLSLPGGWKFVAAIDHCVNAPGEYLNVVRSAPNAPKLPPAFRTCAPSCDHCQTSRDRRSTFVLVNEEGALARIGRNCLKDFLGSDPARALNALEFLEEVSKAAGDGWDDGGGGGGVYAFSPEEVIAWTIKVVRESGWWSRKRADERGVLSTSDRVWSDLTWRPTQHSPNPPVPPTAEDFAKAKEVVAWVEAIDPETEEDYLYNLLANVKRGVVGYAFRNVGIVCSAYSAFRRATEPPPERAARKPRTHLGKVGERFGGSKKGSPAPVTGIIRRTTPYTGMYGEGTVVAFEVDLGEAVADCVWFASGVVVDLEVGATVRVVGSVKAHDKDKRTGEPQTVMNRCELTAS